MLWGVTVELKYPNTIELKHQLHNLFDKNKHFGRRKFLKKELFHARFVFSCNFAHLEQQKSEVMETIRQKQVGELIKRHFSMVLQAEGSYIYGAEVLVSVTSVKMTPDFSLAKIYLSVFNTDNKQATILEMEDQIIRLKQSLVARIRKQIRRIPDIAFYLDDTIDEMYRIDALINRLHDENQIGDGRAEEKE